MIPQWFSVREFNAILRTSRLLRPWSFISLTRVLVALELLTRPRIIFNDDVGHADVFRAAKVRQGDGLSLIVPVCSSRRNEEQRWSFRSLFIF
jgi:hypothetical protein